MPKFNRIAEVEFAVASSQERLVVKNLPYVWDSDECHDMDQPAVFEAIEYLRGKGWAVGLNLIMVSSSPDRPHI